MLSDEVDFAPPPLAAEDTWSRFTSLSKTKQGGALFLEMLFCLISAICLLSSLHTGYATCPLIEMVFAGIFYWVYMNGHSERIPYLDWVWTDIFRCVTATVSLLVISLICIARGRTGSIAGGFTSITSTSCTLGANPRRHYQVGGHA
ncbi:proteolipid protein 2-like isoform X2 [Heterodontus francisci]|uniref:proteolipid protein 2-like isoform X2 n=1 Tax=Heterodontus francisci TaxID=7792 RepID=UPI00355BFBB8